MSFVKKMFALTTCMTFFLMGMDTHKKAIATGSASIGPCNAIGSASIIFSYKELDKISRGSIVVMHATDGLHDDLFALSAGIVTEKGGNDNHAVQLGKKLGIPVIVGVEKATEKISDGSLIELDCSNKTVYEIDKNVETGKAQADFLLKNNRRSVSAPVVLCNLSRDIISSNYWFTSLSCDVSKGDAFDMVTDLSLVSSKDYISNIKICVEKVRGDIAEANRWGKRAAYLFAGISNYTFDCIPDAFFAADPGELDSAYKRFEDNFDQAIKNMQQVKEICKKAEVLINKKIDENKLAEILHKQVVAKIDISDEHRELLNKEPIKMNELVKDGTIKKEQYMDLVLLNFGVKDELEKELKRAQKK